MTTSPERSRILVVEDHPDTRRFLETILSKEYEVITAENGVVGIDHARHKNPDLILLDAVLPILSGYDVCSLLKKDEKTKRIPILFLSAKTQPQEIAQGLAVGGDDYITKPFDHKELLARISARLRKGPESAAPPIEIGDLRIDPGTRDVIYAGKKSKLTLTEFDILRCLASKAGKVVSRDEIIQDVWKDDSTECNHRTIDVHIRALRKKIAPLTRHIISVYGVGYKYEA